MTRMKQRCRTLVLSDSGRPCGESAPNARWTDDEIDALRALVAFGVPVARAAQVLGIPRRTARDVIEGRTRGAPAAWMVVRCGRKTVVR